MYTYCRNIFSGQSPTRPSSSYTEVQQRSWSGFRVIHLTLLGMLSSNASRRPNHHTEDTFFLMSTPFFTPEIRCWRFQWLCSPGTEDNDDNVQVTPAILNVGVHCLCISRKLSRCVGLHHVENSCWWAIHSIQRYFSFMCASTLPTFSIRLECS